MECPNCGEESSGDFCEICGFSFGQIQVEPKSPAKTILSKWWFWVIIIIASIVGANGNKIF